MNVMRLIPFHKGCLAIHKTAQLIPHNSESIPMTLWDSYIHGSSSANRAKNKTDRFDEIFKEIYVFT